jgi:hypothetical protein
VHQDAQLTYAELNAKANRLAGSASNPMRLWQLGLNAPLNSWSLNWPLDGAGRSCVNGWLKNFVYPDNLRGRITSSEIHRVTIASMSGRLRSAGISFAVPI